MEGLMILVALAVAFVLCYIVGTINHFRRLEIKAQEGLSGIEVSLQQRYDLLTKMVDTCKGYMKHEEAMFEKVIVLRKNMNVQDLNQAEARMSELESRIHLVAEQYPDLKSGAVFVELQRGIVSSEAHLQAARRLYNSNVSAYNTAISMFPACLFAMGRKKLEFFAADEGKTRDVRMDFQS